MDQKYQKRLERNLVKYAWLKIFIMRVYLPVIGVYLVMVGRLSLTEIAVIATIATIILFILQMPAGYLADKFGNQWALKLGSVITLTGPLWYLILPNFWGGLIGLTLYQSGQAFMGGTMEALVHDTLVKLNREQQYIKVMGRAVSYGLIGNVVAVTLVPLTYPICQALPFLIGFATQVALFFLVRSFEYPELPRQRAIKDPIEALHKIVTKQNVALFVFYGFLAGAAFMNGVGEYSQLRLTELGVAVGLLGVVMASGSLLGAILGRVIFIFDQVRARAFYLFDLVLMTGCLLLMGLAPNWVVGVAAVIVFVGWTRVRGILYQSKVLVDLKHVYKATLISALNFFANLWQMVMPLVLAWSVATRGGSLAGGYVLFAGIAFLAGMVFWLWIWFAVRGGDSRT